MGDNVAKIYHAGNPRVAMRENDALRCLLSDHLGSTAVSVNGATQAGETRYRPFGAERYSSGQTLTSYKYTGQRSEAGLGLYYYGARWYDPALRRFIQPDTIVPNPGDAQAFDRYAYVNNNPLRYNDPSGHAGNDKAIHDSNDGPPRWLPWGGEGKLAAHYQALTVDWTDLPGATRAILEAHGYDEESYTDPGVATVQTGLRDPATLIASLYGGVRLAWRLPSLLMGACADGDCTNEVETANKLSQSANRLTPDIGRKLDYMLGKATGSQHNIDRSTGMLRQLESIGLPDTQTTRDYLYNHFVQVLNDPNNVVKVQENGRMVRESLLMGPYGGLKLESIWEGSKLITMLLHNGGK